MNDLRYFFPIVTELAEQAGRIARHYFNQPVEFERKADDSPVTRADREIELFLRESLERRFPDHSILGEEFGETRRGSAYRWILDPIDGTKSFVLRAPLFGVMIALERDGAPVLGAVYLPIQEQLLIGSAETGTFFNGERVAVSRTAQVSEATVLLTDPRVLIAEDTPPGVLRVCRRARLVRALGDCYGYVTVARGLADVMIEPGALKYYDVAPMPPIIAGAGGSFTNLRGAVDLYGGEGLATNELLRDELIDLLND